MKKIPLWAVALSIVGIVGCTLCAILFVIPFSRGYIQGSALPTQEAGPTPTHTLLEFEGEGGKVIPLEVPRAGGVIVSGVQVEPGYFSVWVKDTEGNPLDMVVSCLEPCDDSSVTSLPAGEYFLEVEARNRWVVIVSVP